MRKFLDSFVILLFFFSHIFVRRIGIPGAWLVSKIGYAPSEEKQGLLRISDADRFRVECGWITIVLVVIFFVTCVYTH